MSEEEQRAASFLPPTPDEDTTVWRYLDFTQLVSIFEREALWFNRADLYEDPLEGSYSRASVKTRKARFGGDGIPEEHLPDLVDRFSQTAREHRKSSYMNCWHINSYESMAMWDVYASKGDGIAIRSTVGGIKEALREEGGYINGEDTPVDEGVDRLKIFTLGAVQYIDYDEHIIPEGNLYAPLFYKRLSYEHEQEFRIATSAYSVALRQNQFSLSPDGELLTDLPKGHYLGIDLDSLIDKIHVAPMAPDWFSELAQRVVRRYGYDPHLVNRSELDEDPVF